MYIYIYIYILYSRPRRIHRTRGAVDYPKRGQWQHTHTHTRTRAYTPFISFAAAMLLRCPVYTCGGVREREREREGVRGWDGEGERERVRQYSEGVEGEHNMARRVVTIQMFRIRDAERPCQYEFLVFAPELKSAFFFFFLQLLPFRPCPRPSHDFRVFFPATIHITPSGSRAYMSIPFSNSYYV